MQIEGVRARCFFKMKEYLHFHLLDSQTRSSELITESGELLFRWGHTQVSHDRSLRRNLRADAAGIKTKVTSDK